MLLFCVEWGMVATFDSPVFFFSVFFFSWLPSFLYFSKSEVGDKTSIRFWMMLAVVSHCVFFSAVISYSLTCSWKSVFC